MVSFFIEAISNPFTPLPRHPLGVFSFESIRPIRLLCAKVENADTA